MLSNAAQSLKAGTLNLGKNSNYKLFHKQNNADHLLNLQKSIVGNNNFRKTSFSGEQNAAQDSQGLAKVRSLRNLGLKSLQGSSFNKNLLSLPRHLGRGKNRNLSTAGLNNIDDTSQSCNQGATISCSHDLDDETQFRESRVSKYSNIEPRDIKVENRFSLNMIKETDESLVRTLNPSLH